MKKKWIAALAAVACAIVLAGCKDISEPEPIAVESITLNESTFPLKPGETRPLIATVMPYNADYGTVRWSSSNVDVARVDSNGIVKAIKEGTATIYAYAGGSMATCVVTVPSRTVAVESITLDETSLVLEPGGRRILIATITPDNASDRYVTWSSSNPEVVMMNGEIITAVKEGTATITAQAGGRTATCEVTVSETADEPGYIEVEGVMLSRNELIIEPGDTRTLVATVTPYNAGDKTITWSSSDTDVATVDDDGTITAHNEGGTFITAQAGLYGATCVVTVRKILIPVEDVTLDKDEITLTRGTTRKLTATVTPYNADDKTVEWWSSDTEVATVDNDGTVTAVTLGTATIYAKAGYTTAECSVTVNPLPVESITLEMTTLILAPDMERKLVVTVAPDDAKGHPLICSSSNEEVVTVAWYTDECCYLTAHTAGTATITLQAGGKEAKCEITVHTDHSYSGNKCTVCGVELYLKGGGIDTRGVLFGYYSDNAETVVIPDGVAGIDCNAFTYSGHNNTCITSLTIPDSVTFIRMGAFRNCENLSSVTMGDGFTSVESQAFYGCSKITKVTYGGTLAQWCDISWGDIDANPCRGAVLYISGKEMTDVVIPNSVTEIKNYAFIRCKSLTSVKIPGSVTSIGQYAFSSCKSLTSVEIPSSVTSIGRYTFSNCTSLTSVTIPSSVTSIGDYAFSNCTSLTSVTIPSSVTSTGQYTFSNCTALTSVTIPDGVTVIGDYAFKGCTSLTSVTIPKSVTSINCEAFNGTSLTSIEYDGTHADWNAIAIDRYSGLGGKTVIGRNGTWTAAKW